MFFNSNNNSTFLTLIELKHHITNELKKIAINPMMSANFVDSMKLVKYTSEAHLLKSIGTG